METLNRISFTFKNLKGALKSKFSSQSLADFKINIQTLTSDILILGKENNEMFIRSLAMEAYLNLLSSKYLPVSLTEKRNMLHLVFEKLQSYSLRPECLFIFLRIQNLLCYYLLQLEQITPAKDILENLELFYDNLCKSDIENFYDAEDLFTPTLISSISPIDPEKIDKIITNNIQMQAFIYNKLNMTKEYTVYTHTALRRQLDLKEGTPQDWAVRAARLGNYFILLNEPGNARHHLMSAYHVLRTCHENCKLMPEELIVQKSEFEHKLLEISNYWVKYGLMLFNISKKYILSHVFNDSCVKENQWFNSDGAETLISEEHMKDEMSLKNGQGDFSFETVFFFSSLDLKALENRIPSSLVSNPEEARRLFAFTHKWLLRAKKYYDFELQSAQYISCSLQLAELYEQLAFFEKSLDNQYSIQKKRADVLENLNSLLKNCDNGMSIQIDVIRELSQVQLELMALNLQKLWREESQMNMTNLYSDVDSFVDVFKTASTRTFSGKKMNSSSKSLFLRKMEATTSLNGKLFRFCSELASPTASHSNLSTGLLN